MSLLARLRRWSRRPPVMSAAAVDAPRALDTMVEMRLTPEEALVRHGPGMRAWLVRLLDDPDDAEDAYREACVRVIRFADQQRDDAPDALRAWMFRIARREGYRMLRHRVQARRRAVRLRTADADVMPVAGPGLSTALRERQLNQHLLEKLQALLSELSSAEIALLTLRFREGLTHREIGVRLAEGPEPVAEVTIRKRLSRVIAKLRDRAAEAGVEEILAG